MKNFDMDSDFRIRLFYNPCVYSVSKDLVLLSLVFNKILKNTYKSFNKSYENLLLLLDTKAVLKAFAMINVNAFT